MMTNDADLYFELLQAIDHLLTKMAMVDQAHADCPGCDLCLENAALLHTVQLYEGVIHCAAPPETLGRLRRRRDEEELPEEIARHAAAEPRAAGPVPVPVMPAELPPVTTRPYWLPAE